MEVSISLRSVQRMDLEEEVTELAALGTLELLSDRVKLYYTEAAQDGGAVVTITVRGAQVVIERRGEISSQLLLEEGKRHVCRFETPYGRMVLHTQAKRLAFRFEKNAGTLQAAYTLDMNGGYTEQEIEIRIKEVSPC